MAAVFLACAVTLVAAQPRTPLVIPARDRPGFQLPFACGESWRLTTYEGHDDYDIDFFADDSLGTAGRSVLASAAGTVVWAGWDGRTADGATAPAGTVGTSRGLGYGVILDHGRGWVTMYGHFVTWPRVTAGQSVAQGQLLGHVGKTGATRVEHLHYEQLDDTLDASRTRGVKDKIESYFDGEASRITSDGSYQAGPIHLDGAPSPSQHRISRNCGHTAGVSLSGDRRAELISHEGHRLFAFRNNGLHPDGTVAWGGKVMISEGWMGASSSIHFADLSGDGLVDAVSREGDHLYAFRNFGYQANGKVAWGDKVGIGKGWAGHGDKEIFFADLDGDGRADLLSFDNGQLFSWRNNGFHAVEGVRWGARVSILPQPVPGGTFFADLDGDGRADLLSLDNGQLFSWRNNGYLPDGTVSWGARVAIGAPPGLTGDLHFGDLDGDARADLLTQEGTRLFLVRNNGYQPDGTVSWAPKLEIGSAWTVSHDSLFLS